MLSPVLNKIAMGIVLAAGGQGLSAAYTPNVLREPVFYRPRPTPGKHGAGKFAMNPG